MAPVGRVCTILHQTNTISQKLTLQVTSPKSQWSELRRVTGPKVGTSDIRSRTGTVRHGGRSRRVAVCSPFWVVYRRWQDGWLHRHGLFCQSCNSHSPETSLEMPLNYIRHVNGVKLVETMFSVLCVCVCVCVCVCLCALSPIGLNGRNDVLYSTRAWKVENISVRTIYRWKRRFIGFLKI